ncbi:MAG: hypothetical protein VYB72_00245 [Planctomycetota bacterium]|nr:hypothetical protein [Planctomycetota bacterium]
MGFTPRLLAIAPPIRLELALVDQDFSVSCHSHTKPPVANAN